MSVYKIRFGTPEEHVPTAYAPKPLCDVQTLAPTDSPRAIRCDIDRCGVRLCIPVAPETDIYGGGLQLKSLLRNGKKVTLRPNADPRSDSGDSHAPVPFFVTTEGFGIFLDTARHASFYFGRTLKPSDKPQETDALSDLNRLFDHKPGDCLQVEIPVAQGVDLYYITGDSVLDIVCSYNLLSGGGCMPPLWGLGGFYRCDLKFSDREVLEMAEKFRALHIPCDIIGLEPGWQTHTYSCSYRWDSARFPDPRKLVQTLRGEGFHVNLWEHAFTHPTAANYEALLPYSGDTLVWGGLVPDLSLPEAREAFLPPQKELTDIGVDGFKLDECDGSDFTGGWSFPNRAQFPSGMDGEQYHSLFGLLYAQTMQSLLGDKRTLSEVRNMGALAASYPFVLYSDLYAHQDFLTGVVNAGFCGLLWSPEVRHAENREELLRRIQSVIFSPQALVNAFYLSEMPWIQHNCVDEVRELFGIRMSLLPYLYTAFYDYKTLGKPPVRALVCDYQLQAESHGIADEWLFGDSIIVAPLSYPAHSRTVWLPEGDWFDLFTGTPVQGGSFTVETDGIPAYVKGGTLLPWAAPKEHVEENGSFSVTLRAYGDCSDAHCRLIEDDGVTHSTTYRVLDISYADAVAGKLPQSARYNVLGIETIRRP